MRNFLLRWIITTALVSALATAFASIAWLLPSHPKIAGLIGAAAFLWWMAVGAKIDVFNLKRWWP